jgi:hypothetical protein
VNKWEKRGAAARKSGKWQNAFYAWKDARGKPAVKNNGVMRIDPNTERYQAARADFVEGFRSMKNPKSRKKKKGGGGLSAASMVVIGVALGVVVLAVANGGE